MSVLIEAEDLHFAYGPRPVLDGLSFRVHAGDLYGLVGADGAGKTTLLRLAAGQLDGAKGALRVLGGDPTRSEIRQQIAYMPQDFGLYRDLSVIENLQFFADLHGLSRRAAQQRVGDLLSRTGLQGFEARRAGKLSGGMMQKLALACALVSEPRVIFLDEPTTGVDPMSRRAFWRLLDGIRVDGVAIFCATANLDEAERCDRVALLQRGRIDLQGSPGELLSRPDARFVEIVGQGVRALRERLQGLEEVRLLYPVGSRLHAWLAPDVSLHALQEKLPDRALTVEAREPALHDVAIFELALAERSVDRD